MYFFFNDTATTEIYSLSLHDALPISVREAAQVLAVRGGVPALLDDPDGDGAHVGAIEVAEKRSEEHTSELQSRSDLVCRLLLEKKTKRRITFMQTVSNLKLLRQFSCT